jgi:hypothetical protein
MGFIIALICFLVFGLGWLFAGNSVRNDCERMGVTVVDGVVLECRVKTKL